MRRLITSVAVLAVVSLAIAAPKHEPVASEDGIAVYFSPDGGCAAAVVQAMDGARSSVDIAIYSITHKDIAASIVAAHKRGVIVRVVLDKSQSSGRYSSATFLANAGIAVWTDDNKGRALMHHKYTVIDGETVLTGSFNYTKGGDEENAENLLVIEGKPKLAKAYSENFTTLLRTALSYDASKSNTPPTTSDNPVK